MLIPTGALNHQCKGSSVAVLTLAPPVSLFVEPLWAGSGQWGGGGEGEGGGGGEGGSNPPSRG